MPIWLKAEIDEKPAHSIKYQMTAALLDRLTHHCDVVETGNESWRFKRREAACSRLTGSVSAAPWRTWSKQL